MLHNTAWPIPLWVTSILYRNFYLCIKMREATVPYSPHVEGDPPVELLGLGNDEGVRSLLLLLWQETSCSKNRNTCHTASPHVWLMLPIEEGFIQKRRLLCCLRDIIYSIPCTGKIWRIGWIHPFFFISSMVQNSKRGKEFNHFCPKQPVWWPRAQVIMILFFLTWVIYTVGI